MIEFAGCQRVVLDTPLSPVQSRPLTCAAGCQRVVLDVPFSPVQSRPLTCAAGCQRVVLDAPLSLVQSRPISRGRHVSLPSRYHNIRCVKAT